MDISKDKRKQIIYQKTEFNTFSICQYNCILKCIKCKRNNNILPDKNIFIQPCLFCGTPNYVKNLK